MRSAPGWELYRDDDGRLLATVIRTDFVGGKYNFVTDDFPLQVGTSFYETGEVIDRHLHPPLERRLEVVNEFVFVKRGCVRLHLYALDRREVASVELREGDCLLLSGGGHGFDVLEPTQLIEVKQGPYLGAGDKVKW